MAVRLAGTVTPMVAAHAPNLLPHTKSALSNYTPAQLHAAIASWLHEFHSSILSSGHSVSALHVSIGKYIYLTCGRLPGSALTSCVPSQPSDTTSGVSESSGTRIEKFSPAAQCHRLEMVLWMRSTLATEQFTRGLMKPYRSQQKLEASPDGTLRSDRQRCSTTAEKVRGS